MRAFAVLLAALAVTLGSCQTTRKAEVLASAQVATDFDTYNVRRVGLTPFVSEIPLRPEQAEALESAFFTEASRSTPYEIVPLEIADLEEIPRNDAYRKGIFQPRMVIDLSRRYMLDAILVGTVTDLQTYPPQRLSVQLDLVASETGLVIWSASVHLDAQDERVREGMRTLWGETETDAGDAWEISLLSPSRFAQFAAHQIAQLL